MADTDDPSGVLGGSIGQIHFAQGKAGSVKIAATDHHTLDGIVVFGYGTDHFASDLGSLVGCYRDLGCLTVRCAYQFLAA